MRHTTMNKKKTTERLGMLALLLLGSSAAVAANCKGEDLSKAPQVAQKIALLERLLTNSEPLRRAEASGDPAALEQLAGARQILADARQALDDDCLAQASQLSSDGLKAATAGVQVRIAYENGSPRRIATWREKAEHQDVYECAEETDIVVTATDLGYLWADTYAT